MKYLLLLLLLPFGAFGQERIVLPQAAGPQYETRPGMTYIEQHPPFRIGPRNNGTVYVIDGVILGQEYSRRQPGDLKCLPLPTGSGQFPRLFENKYTEADFRPIPLTTFLAQLPEMRTR